MRDVKELWLGKREDSPNVIVEIFFEHPYGYHYDAYTCKGDPEEVKTIGYMGFETCRSFVQKTAFKNVYEWVKLR